LVIVATADPSVDLIIREAASDPQLEILHTTISTGVVIS
jgi:hypothetical protein